MDKDVNSKDETSKEESGPSAEGEFLKSDIL